MKKAAFILCAVLALGFVSCKKCMTCRVVAGSSYSSYPEEKCGTQSQLDEFEDMYKDLAKDSPHVGARAECTTN